ncbi:MAG: hypothetical protein IT429_00995 [Gemmataceae bacterium]|nr:hypothetical protein [Gemmataceae bacterium]
MFPRWSAMVLLGAFPLAWTARAGGDEEVKRVEGATAEAIARLCDEALKKAGKPGPFKVAPNLARSVGLQARAAAGLVIPDRGLSVEAFRKLDREILPVGILCTTKITVVVGDEPVPADQHRTIEVTKDGKATTLAVMYLAAAKVAGRLVLLLYTDSNTPVFVTSLVDANVGGDLPIDLAARRGGGDNRATVLLTILGIYRAAIPVAAAD